MKVITRFIFFLVLVLLLLRIFTPYKYNESNDRKEVLASVLIERSASDVFNYLSKSSSANEWSVFVDHITNLNADQIPDGAVGCLRRCFVNADKSGRTWDERIEEVRTNEYRRLSCFNFKAFPMQADGLQTEQIYESVDGNKCRLTLTLFFEQRPGFAARAKMMFAAYIVKNIFKRNIKNIKTILEAS